MNPDEVVAVGAAIQGAVLSGDVTDVLLLDVTPLTLGIETQGGVLTPMITGNTTIPTRKSEIFSTASDSQPSVEVHILQGERPMAADNKSLGRFHLDGIPPAPRGTPQIEVTFDIDANGILNVMAKDKATNKEQSIRITSSSGLDKSEIEKMKREAQENSAADKKRREEVDLRNDADRLVFSTKKQIEELGDKMQGDGKAKLDASLEKLETALKSGTIDGRARRMSWIERGAKYRKQCTRKRRRSNRPVNTLQRGLQRTERHTQRMRIILSLRTRSSSRVVT